MKSKKPNKSNPENWSEAIAAYQQGQPEKAAKLCKTVISRYPNHSDANNLLGAIALSSKDYAAALTAFGKAIAGNQKNASYHNNLGIALRGLQRFEEARQSYEKAIVLQENYPDAYFNLGNVLRDLGDDEKAVEAFRHATKLKTDENKGVCGRARSIIPVGESPTLARSEIVNVVVASTVKSYSGLYYE